MSRPRCLGDRVGETIRGRKGSQRESVTVVSVTGIALESVLRDSGGQR